MSLCREIVYSGRILDVAVEKHRLPNDRESTFEIIRHPGGAAVLPVLPDGRLLLIRQFRPAVGEMIYEIPAGRLEPGETAVQCAVREMEEEIGYTANRMVSLGGFWSTVGFCDEYIHLFLGLDLSATQQCLEADEVIELCPMSIDQAFEKINNGDILDGKTLLALLRFKLLPPEHD